MRVAFFFAFIVCLGFDRVRGISTCRAYVYVCWHIFLSLAPTCRWCRASSSSSSFVVRLACWQSCCPSFSWCSLCSTAERVVSGTALQFFVFAYNILANEELYPSFPSPVPGFPWVKARETLAPPPISVRLAHRVYKTPGGR